MSKVWQCPLCDFSTTSDDVTASVIRHATERHPAYLPDRQTVADMLDLIPSLVREAWVTIGAPNPGGEVGRAPHVAGSRVPAELWVMEALRGDDGREADSKVLISRLVECSRLIWESLDADTRAAHPQALGSPQWATEVAWLSAAWPDAQAWLDPCDASWIEDEVREIQHTLAAICKLGPRPKSLCPDCREPLSLHDDGWMRCPSNHQHPGPKRLESQWRRKAPMPSAELCDALRIPRGTLRRWHHEGRISPTRIDGQTHYWLPWDAIGLRYPDVVREIDERDAA